MIDYYRITFLDFDKAEDFQDKKDEFTQNNQSLQESPNINGQFDLFKTPDEILSLNFISNKGLEYPKVYENGKIVMNKEFHDQMKQNMKWIGHLLVGTSNGDCFSIQFGETKDGEFTKTQTKLFSRGQPIDKKDPLLRVKKESIYNDESGDEPKKKKRTMEKNIKK